MKIRPVLLSALAAASHSGCAGKWQPVCGDTTGDDVDVSQTLSAAEVDGMLEWYDSDSGTDGTTLAVDDLTCEEVCLYAVRVINSDSVGALVDLDECALSFESAGGETTGTIECSGTSQYYCEGRRPQGHQETDLTGAGLGDVLGQLAALEAASVPAFEELADQLASMGLSAELVAAARRAAEDERRHARWMTRLARRHGGQVHEPQRGDRGSSTPYAVALHNAVEGCVHETFAALVAAHRARHATHPHIRAVYARIAEDEARHAQLAWDVHDAVRACLTATEQAKVDAARATAMALLPTRAARMAPRLPEALGADPETLVQLAHALQERLAA